MKNINKFNLGRKPAFVSPTPVSSAIPTLPKKCEYKTESIEEYLQRTGKVSYCNSKGTPKQSQQSKKEVMPSNVFVLPISKPSPFDPNKNPNNVVAPVFILRKAANKIAS